MICKKSETNNFCISKRSDFQKKTRLLSIWPYIIKYLTFVHNKLRNFDDETMIKTIVGCFCVYRPDSAFELTPHYMHIFSSEKVNYIISQSSTPSLAILAQHQTFQCTAGRGHTNALWGNRGAEQVKTDKNQLKFGNNSNLIKVLQQLGDTCTFT